MSCSTSYSANGWTTCRPTGCALETVEAFAGAHDGNAPVLVFVDPSGEFGNDTECVNGSRGNVADYLTKDLVPYMASNSE